jgi:hypothetical protein
MAIKLPDLPEEVKELFKKNVQTLNDDNDSEGSIVKHYETDTLYKNDFKEGSYFSLVGENKLEMQLSERIKFTIAFIKNKNDISSISIEKYTFKAGKWIGTEKVSISKFNFEKMVSFLEFLRKHNLLDLSERKIHLTEDMFQNVDNETKEKLFQSLTDEVKLSVIKAALDEENISSVDIVGLGYRKKQLGIFKKLLDDEVFFQKCKTQLKKTRDEDVWHVEHTIPFVHTVKIPVLRFLRKVGVDWKEAQKTVR